MNIHLALLSPILFSLAACIPMGQRASAPSGSGGGAGGSSFSGATGPATGGTPPSGSSSSRAASGRAAPSAPTTASVTLRSDCPKTVKVFYGNKPKFGSGTYSSIETNSVSSHTFKAGDMFWIVDDSENGVASVTISGDTHEIKVSSDCKHLSAN